ncbi:MAG: immunity 17 family protein [Oscillospiraceae bacterium]|nr:immunity 17 family protein [Oscillospiraceae bacterium]
MMIVMGLVFAAIGLFSLMGAVMNWDWYFNNRRARGVVAIFGRNGARIFYGILGVFIMAIGAVAAIGGILGW